MMAWHYGLVKLEDGYLIAEIFPDVIDGKVGYGDIYTTWDTPEEAIQSLKEMLEDCQHYPVHEPKIEQKENPAE